MRIQIEFINKFYLKPKVHQIVPVIKRGTYRGTYFINNEKYIKIALK